jgi:hypothetical protein
MSDAPEQRRGATAPLPMTAQPSTAPLPRAPTQMSASAVPSTLESPREPNQADGAGAPIPPTVNGEIHGAMLKHDVTERDDNARVAAERDAGLARVAAGLEAGIALEAGVPPTQDPSRRGGPATLMSPAVAHPGDLPPSPSLAPEDAVIDVGAPAHAFMPHASASPPHAGGPGVMMHHGAHAAVGGGVPERRATSTTFLVMVVVGGVAGVILLAGIVVGLFYLGERRKAEADAAERALRAASVTAAPATAEGPRGPARFGGTKARLAVTSGGAMDPEAVRAALAGALPKIDACFAATELEAPNHESAAYDLDVLASGEVKRVEVGTPANRAAKLDACVLQNLRGVRMPKSARASTVKLTFSAPLDVR